MKLKNILAMAGIMLFSAQANAQNNVSASANVISNGKQFGSLETKASYAQPIFRDFGIFASTDIYKSIQGNNSFQTHSYGGVGLTIKEDSVQAFAGPIWVKNYSDFQNLNLLGVAIKIKSNLGDVKFQGEYVGSVHNLIQKKDDNGVKIAKKTRIITRESIELIWKKNYFELEFEQQSTDDAGNPKKLDTKKYSYAREFFPKGNTNHRFYAKFTWQQGLWTQDYERAFKTKGNIFFLGLEYHLNY